jgi:hypothetical protein
VSSSKQALNRALKDGKIAAGIKLKGPLQKMKSDPFGDPLSFKWKQMLGQLRFPARSKVKRLISD